MGVDQEFSLSSRDLPSLPARLRIPTDCRVQVGMQVLTGVELARPLAGSAVRQRRGLVGTGCSNKCPSLWDSGIGQRDGTEG